MDGPGVKEESCERHDAEGDGDAVQDQPRDQEVPILEHHGWGIKSVLNTFT